MSIAGILSLAKHLLQQWPWELEVDSMICCVVWTKLCRWLWELVRWQQVLWPLLESYLQVTHVHCCTGAPDFCVDCWSLTFRFSWRVMDILLEWYFVMESYGHIAGMILCLALELVAVLFILSVMDTLVRHARASSHPPRRLRHHPACRHPCRCRTVPHAVVFVRSWLLTSLGLRSWSCYYLYYVSFGTLCLLVSSLYLLLLKLPLMFFFQETMGKKTTRS